MGCQAFGEKRRTHNVSRYRESYLSGVDMSTGEAMLHTILYGNVTLAVNVKCV